MKWYAVAEINITDPAWIPVYVERTTKLVEQHGRALPGANAKYRELEGDRPPAQIYLIIEWPSKAAAEAFYESDEYKPSLASRKHGSTSEFVLVAGEDINRIARM